MKFTSITTTFALATVAVAAPAPAQQPDGIPSGFLRSSVSIPSGFPIPTGFSGFKKQEGVAFPTGAFPDNNAVVPTGRTNVKIPLATGESQPAETPSYHHRRPVLRRSMHEERSNPEPHVPQGGFATGSLSAPTGAILAAPTGKKLFPTGSAF